MKLMQIPYWRLRSGPFLARCNHAAALPGLAQDGGARWRNAAAVVYTHPYAVMILPGKVPITASSADSWRYFRGDARVPKSIQTAQTIHCLRPADAVVADRRGARWRGCRCCAMAFA